MCGYSVHLHFIITPVFTGKIHKMQNFAIDFDAFKEAAGGIGQNLDTYLDAQSLNAKNAAEYNAAQIANMKAEQENRNKMVDLLGKSVLVVVGVVALIALVKAFKM